jgi:hypothetical protein
VYAVAATSPGVGDWYVGDGCAAGASTHAPVMSYPAPRLVAVALVVAVALAAVGCATTTGAAPGGPAAAVGPASVDGTAIAALGALEVKGRAPKTGYDRDLFGPAWSDVDANGCDTRNDILRRDLRGVALRSDGCTVQTGVLDDPYTGDTIAFQRGQSTSSAVQIDHVVALSDAWQKGAQQLDAATRRAFANDPLELLAVDGPANMAKGDGDAATWLPPQRSYRCAYVARQIAVKVKYRLWVTEAERDAMAGVLDTCPEEPLPSG